MKWLISYVRKPGLWFILALLILLTLLHYQETQEYPGFIVSIISELGLNRHAFERILYLAPIVWSGFLLGWKGSLVTSVIVLACLLPRVILVSEYPKDALFETGAVFIIGNVVSISFYALRREREHRMQLETAHKEQKQITQKLQVMQQNLRHYLQQATRAQEEERKRISHELHDDTIQALVVLSRQLDALASGDNKLSEENRKTLEELWQQTDNILKGVRRLSQDLRPAALDRLGLLPALEWLAANVTEHSGIETTVNVVGEELQPSEEVSIALFRIIQEALRNIWRHSEATNAEINVEFRENLIIIGISDNGKGFELPEDISDLANTGKLGLIGMQERVQLIGGKLKVESASGEGTKITVELPSSDMLL